MSEPVEGGDSTVVTQNGVTVERHLERKGDGIVVTMDLSADVRGPAEVDLVDEFPPALPVKQAGFNVDHEPDDGEVSLGRVVLRHTIEAATETVVYAIRLEEGADDVAFEPPTIRDVTFPDIPEPDVLDDESAEVEPTNGAPEGDETADAGAADEPDGPGEPAADGAASTGGGGLPGGLSLDGSVAEPTDEASEGPVDSAAAPDGREPIDDGDDDVDPIESALERAEADGDGLAGATKEGKTAADGAVPDADATAGDRVRRGGTAAGPPRTDDAAVPADAPEEETVPRSVKLKLDRLNARVEEFAAYAEALEGIIDRHGTVPEILDGIEADLDDADDRLAEVREEVDALDDRHASDVGDVRDRIDALEERFQDARRDVASEVDGLDARVADYEDDVEDLSRTVGSVASEVSEVSRNVEAMRSEMESLQDDVDRLLRFREILADVFGGPVRRATEGGGDPFGDVGRSDRDADRPGSDDRGTDGDVETGGHSYSTNSSG